MLNKLYEEYCNTPSDINEHLPKLIELGSLVNHITEFGVRTGVSTVALLASQPKKLISYDINPFGDYYKLKELQGDTDFQFIQESSLEVEIEPTEFLFIDTLHTYNQLIQELTLHHHKVSKYIGLHDTTLFGENGEWETLGLNYAIDEFLAKNKEWSIIYKTDKNNGLTVLHKN